MTKVVVDCLDYDGGPGSIEVEGDKYHGEPRVRIEATDSDDHVIIYPTVEEAQALVVALLQCIHAVKHGEEGS